MLAWGVVGTVSSFSQLQHTGRIDAPLIEVARFAGRFVVQSLAASADVAADAIDEGHERLLALVTAAS
jgi:hypothetical protein